MSGNEFEKDLFLRLLRKRAEVRRQLKEAGDDAIAELEESLVPRIVEIEAELAKIAPTTWAGRAAAAAFLEYELEEHYYQGQSGFQFQLYRALLAGIREGLPAAPDWLRKDLTEFTDWQMFRVEPESSA